MKEDVAVEDLDELGKQEGVTLLRFMGRRWSFDHDACEMAGQFVVWDDVNSVLGFTSYKEETEE